jgi:hypothetical protein
MGTRWELQRRSLPVFALASVSLQACSMLRLKLTMPNETTNALDVISSLERCLFTRLVYIRYSTWAMWLSTFRLTACAEH